MEQEARQELDWLEGDSELIRDQNRANAIAFAQNYSIFVNDPRGIALLEHWDQTLNRKRTPVNASHAEYAADEAVRAFINGIHTQIKLAKERVG